MKNIIIILNLLLAVQLSAQKVKTSGEWLMGENKGKSFVLAPNEYMDLYLGTVEAYNAGDVERKFLFTKQHLVLKTENLPRTGMPLLKK